MDSDVVIVGGGLAGLVTAVRCAELGLKPVVLEQGTDPEYLCNSRITGGVIHFASEGMNDPPDSLVGKVTRITDGFVDAGLIAKVAGDAARAVQWLKGHNARFTRTDNHPSHQWIMAPLRLPRFGVDPAGWRGRSGDAVLKLLTDLLVRLGGRLDLGTKAQSLILEGGRCVGVTAMCAGAEVSYRATAVVLADGGFQGDPELVGRFISKHPEKIRQRGAGTGKGDAIRMLEAVGAKLTGMKYFYGHLLSRDAMTREDLWPYPGLDPLAVVGIVVDGSGRRFADEGLGGVFLTNAVAWHDDPLDTWIIFDETIWQTAGMNQVFLTSPNPVLEQLKAPMFKADSLDELEQKAGFANGTLSATVAEHNGAIEGKALAQLKPARSDHTFKPAPILKKPFYAVPMCAGLTFTMGGGAVDHDMRVLKPDGSAIPGLWASGKSLGGLEGGDPVGYTGGLCLALITGIRAGEAIARR